MTSVLAPALVPVSVLAAQSPADNPVGCLGDDFQPTQALLQNLAGEPNNEAIILAPCGTNNSLWGFPYRYLNYDGVPRRMWNRMTGDLIAVISQEGYIQPVYQSSDHEYVQQKLNTHTILALRGDKTANTVSLPEFSAEHTCRAVGWNIGQVVNSDFIVRYTN